MSTLKSYKLGELYDVSSGLSKAREEFGFGNPFVTFKDVFYNFFLPDKLTSLVNTSDKEVKSCSVKKGDIFLTRTSETFDELGMSCVSLRDYERATFNGFTKRLRQKENSKVEIDPVFIGYYFRSTSIRNQISMFASMTTRASLNSQAINSIEISIPEIEIQKRIGVILKSFDDKIELNHQMNHTMEQMAQALFKKYFVDDIDLDNLPKGWRIGKLEEIVNNFDSKRVPLSSMQRGVRKGPYPYYGAASLMDYVDDYLFDGLFVLLGEDGTVVTDDGYPVLQYTWGKFWVNNHAHVLQGTDYISTNFLYLLLKQTSIVHLVTGAVQPKINQGNLNNIDVVIPDKEILVKFNSVVDPLYDKFRSNSEEVETLTKLRDGLLPKLMSGEVSVEQASATA